MNEDVQKLLLEEIKKLQVTVENGYRELLTAGLGGNHDLIRDQLSCDYLLKDIDGKLEALLGEFKINQ